ncbi:TRANSMEMBRANE PROTEIN [Salix purpurea]|uniref:TRANSMEMBRANE PROTEIN n=1 Tax=Salix purpurea TaxID=77065 RepID=A0A9Q0VXI8_SALPP|nr:TRANSMEMBRANE PROTEIN [Salix purpurea]
MDIPERVLQYRFHLAAAIAASLVLSLLLYASPGLITIVAYFWPLFASTAVFLMLIIVFGGVPQLATDYHGGKSSTLESKSRTDLFSSYQCIRRSKLSRES